MPYDVPPTSTRTWRRQFSTSRGWAACARCWRSTTRTHQVHADHQHAGTRDTTLLSEFIRRNNDELVATYGNLVHRPHLHPALPEGQVPVVGPDYQGDERMIARTRGLRHGGDMLAERTSTR